MERGFARKSGLKESQELGVAVIGLGVGEQHARVYARLKSCSLRWLFDLDPAIVDRVAQELGEVPSAEDIETILDDPSVDVVSVASYDDAHFRQVLAALRAGKHVFVEKPLCRSRDELREIKRAWSEGADRHLLSNLVLRAAPLYRWLKEAVEGGELGEIYAFDGDYLYGRLWKITDGWRKDVVNYSVMQGGGVHLVDLMLWITGQRPVSVEAAGNRMSTEGTEFRYNDYMSATYQFASGLIGRITANFGSVHPHQHVVRVFGTKGTLIYDDQGPRLFSSRDPELPAKFLDLSPLPASKGDLIPDFVKSISDGSDTRAAIHHEFDLISACTAADEALAAATPVEIEYV